MRPDAAMKSNRVHKTAASGTDPETPAHHCEDGHSGHAHDHAGMSHQAGPAAKSADATGAQPVEYTCPMHPQVRQIGPGHCPICGMGLEPVIATADAGEIPELRDMTRRFWRNGHRSCPSLQKRSCLEPSD